MHRPQNWRTEHRLPGSAGSIRNGGATGPRARSGPGGGRLRTELTAFVCYDKRLSDSARALGLPVEAPA